MKFKQSAVSLLALACSVAASATPVKVTMNSTSTTMVLTAKGSEEKIETGAPTSRVYEFDVPAGEYVLTAYATDGTTVNGIIELEVPDSETVTEFSVLTCTAYVANKTDGVAWTVDNGDYTLNVEVNTREGDAVKQTYGRSITAGRNTFLALNGNSYYVEFIPGKQHADEGYTTLKKMGTLTANVNVYGTIPVATYLTVTVPENAEIQIGEKKVHFTDFIITAPEETLISNGTKQLKYRVGNGMQYNYRTWKEGGLTYGGYFTASSDPAKQPDLTFTNEMYAAHDPAAINHDVQSNQGYETGDIFVNVNERGHKQMNVGEVFEAHAMRTWELTDNSTNNYFIEPDFHYTVIGLDGKPSTGVIEISQNPGSAWADIKAIGNGTAIVLVTYDGINLNYYSTNGAKSAYLGGEYWGAIWPENTGVYVVTVGEGESAVKPEMLINEEYNLDTKKNAGKYVDAEHDTFYYLDTEKGATYTFTPEGVDNITLAYPVIGERMTVYSGFGADGVTKNEDGSYTLLLKHGRNIVRLTDASGKSVYQILNARPCHREIINASREGSNIFQPGDQIKIQYSGLFHPANKLAGIYNMSAYVTYNGTPNGTSLILGSGQYTFGSAASAQAVTITIPEDHDVSASPTIDMTEGVIQVNGYGDPIGNHRVIDYIGGRSPNFTAIAHKTYFGALPDISIPLTATRNFEIIVQSNENDADIEVKFKGSALTPDNNGKYTGTYGAYTVTAKKAGYRCFHSVFEIPDDANDEPQIFAINMVEAPDAWDGTTMTEPAKNADGSYVISTPAELAWFADNVNTGNYASKAVLTADIDLGDYEWTPIGTASTKSFTGTFTGCGHRIDGLYVNFPATNNIGLFGYVKGTSSAKASISGITVSGEVKGKQYVGGIVGYLNTYASIDTCANYADVTAVVNGTSGGTYAGGIAGNISSNSSLISNCYNAGTIIATNSAGGVVGGFSSTTSDRLENVYNIGEIKCETLSSAIIGSKAAANVKNAYATKDYELTGSYTLVTDEQMASGEVAYKLGKAFGQKLGEDPYPVFGAPEVLLDESTGKYYNDSSAITDVTTDGAAAVPVMYYNLQGIPSATPYEGLNIVRFSDGSARKIYYKPE